MKNLATILLLVSSGIAMAQPGEAFALRKQIYSDYYDTLDLAKYTFKLNTLVVFQNGYEMTTVFFMNIFRSQKRTDTTQTGKAKFLDDVIVMQQKVFEGMDQGIDTTTAFKLEFLKHKQNSLTPYFNEGYTRLEAEALPEFKYAMRQYYDGIILFELMNKEVWKKGNSDNEALRNFYNEHLALYQGQTFEISRTKVVHDYQAELEKQLIAKSASKFPCKINVELLGRL